MAARRFAWVLNLDADVELAQLRAHGYTPKRSVREAMLPFVTRLAASLLGPEDLLVADATTPGSAIGLVGRAFCPTPWAVAQLRRAGAEPEPHPTASVLRRVNSRAFATSLGPTLPGAAFVVDLDAARAMLAEKPPVGDGWRVKRNFGMTGRGQRMLAPGAAGHADLAFVKAGLEEGGVQIEPQVTIVAEYAIHGLIAADGSSALGAVVRQRCDHRGAWLATEPLPEPTPDERDLVARLGAEGERVASALVEVGYFGPFGIDAYTYRDAKGDIDIQIRSEINARYSMGFVVGGLRAPQGAGGDR